MFVRSTQLLVLMAKFLMSEAMVSFVSRTRRSPLLA